jgi:hypothetical protein
LAINGEKQAILDRLIPTARSVGHGTVFRKRGDPSTINQKSLI